MNTTKPYTQEHYELAGRDAGLGVGHIWYRVACPAYTTYNPADCSCQAMGVAS